MSKYFAYITILVSLFWLAACDIDFEPRTSSKSIENYFIDTEIVKGDSTKNLVISFRLDVERESNLLNFKMSRGQPLKVPHYQVRNGNQILSILDTTGKKLKQFDDYIVVEGDLVSYGINTANGFTLQPQDSEYRKTYVIKILRKGVYAINYIGGSMFLKPTTSGKYWEHEVWADFSAKSRNQYLLPLFRKGVLRENLSDKTPPLVEPAGPGAYYLFEIK